MWQEIVWKFIFAFHDDIFSVLFVLNLSSKIQIHEIIQITNCDWSCIILRQYLKRFGTFRSNREKKLLRLTNHRLEFQHRLTIELSCDFLEPFKLIFTRTCWSNWFSRCRKLLRLRLSERPAAGRISYGFEILYWINLFFKFHIVGRS